VEGRPGASDEGGLRALLLFLVTLASVYSCHGFLSLGGNPFTNPEIARPSALFAAALMAILGAHEMGHYVVARLHGFRLTLPLFIPVPFGFGTLGAIIRLKSLPRERSALLEMGAAGPIAGALLAFLFLWIGLGLSTEIAPPSETMFIAADPPVLSLMARILGRAPLDPLLILHPLAEAGWVGCLVTSINLLPIGQLDGGHVLGALWPDRARLRSLVFLNLAALGAFVWLGWGVWAVVIVAIGAWRSLPVPRRPPLSRRARLVAGAALVVFLLTFMPVPLRELETPAGDPPQPPESVEDSAPDTAWLDETPPPPR
jgi:membrane-associated protease RseP (regulator of RpoE activity)